MEMIWELFKYLQSKDLAAYSIVNKRSHSIYPFELRKNIELPIWKFKSNLKFYDLLLEVKLVTGIVECERVKKTGYG